MVAKEVKLIVLTEAIEQLEALNNQWSMESRRVKASHNILVLKARLIALK